MYNVKIGSVLLIVSCLISSGTAELDKSVVGCSLNKLPENKKISCSDVDHSPIQTENILVVPQNTYCTLKCGETFKRNAFAYCLGTTWTGTISECGKTIPESSQKEWNGNGIDGVDYPLQQHKRVKRWWGWCWWWWRCRRNRDRTPPSLTCPPSQTVFAGSMQTYAPAYWTKPTAYDSKDGYVAVYNLYWHTYSGRWFSQGTTINGYYARDRSGNMARCYFYITVRVTRCSRPRWIQNGYARCYPNDMRKGTTCEFYCYKGHELQGSRKSVCYGYGYWGHWSYPKPTCERVQCPTMIAQNKMSISCTDSNRYRSVCTMTCQGGYDIPRGVHRIRVCQHDKTWSGVDTVCEDIEAPRFTNCPASLTFYVPKHKESTAVYWNDPDVEDNSGFTVTPYQYDGPKSTSVLSVGVYTVTYTARDRNGNTAKPCQIKIVVKQIRCHNLHATPYTDIECTGARYGSTCRFTCMEGAVLEGHHAAECQRQGDPPYGYWDWKSRQPYCKLLDACPLPTAPVHGALACDTWLNGKYCQMMCNSGYTVNKGRSFPHLMVCNNDGMWSHGVEQCATKLTSSQSARVKATFKFEHFDGDCSSEETQQIIKLNFIKILEGSNFAVHCKQNDGCSWQNVKVICGKTERRKRETDSSSTGNRFKRDTSDMTIEMEIEYTTDADGIDKDSYKQIHENNTKNVDTLSDDINSGNIVFSFDNNTAKPVLETSDPDLDCVNNTISSLSTYSCMECTNGSYVDTTKKECIDCPKGTYQPEAGQNECKPCPAKTSTANMGSSSSAECLDACPPGSFSKNTVLPCTPCDVGTYQNKYGSTECIPCPGSKITDNDQATSEDNCQDFDIVFPKNQSLGVVLPLDTTHVLQEFTLTGRFECDGQCYGNILKMNEDAGVLLGLEFQEHIILHVLRYAYKTTLEVPTPRRWHSLVFRKTGNQLSVNIDSSSAFNQSIPGDIDFNITSLTIGENFTGVISQLNVFSNESSLADIEVLANKCVHEAFGDIVGYRDLKEATLNNAFLQIPSQCDDVDECVSSPCVNGTCIDELLSYECDCDFGFTGNNCDVNIDDCAVNGCQNNASCVDEIGNYTCECQDLFTGAFCEIEQVNGGWGSWDSWSSCTVTCGNGTKTRTRECDDPAPDNGGLECEGNATDTSECTAEECRVCSTLKEPDNSDLVCTETDEMTRCILTCDPGYEFDIAPPDTYTCGNETGHMWDFKTDDNAQTKLPSCSATEEAEKVKFQHTMSYYNLTCSEGTDDKDIIYNKVDGVVQNLTCIINDSCTKESLTVNNCDVHRRKRDTKAAGFTITLGCEPTVVGTQTCYDTITKAVEEIKEHGESGSLTITKDGLTYLINMNSTSFDDDLTCTAGAVPVQGYCVPCAPGHYFVNDECELCERGTYQDEYKQTSCKSCPEDTITPGTGSANISECIPVQDNKPKIDDDEIALGISIGIGIATLVGIIFLLFLLKLLCNKTSNTKKKTIDSSQVSLSDQVPNKQKVEAWGSKAPTTVNSNVKIETTIFGINTPPMIAQSVPPISTQMPRTINDDMTVEDIECQEDILHESIFIDNSIKREFTTSSD